MKGRRRGFTLIEMIAAFTAGVVALGLSITLIQSLMRLDQSGRARLSEGAMLGQLARTFRDDVHAARSVQLGERLELRMSADEVITYGPDAGRLVRTRRVEGDVEHVESYRPPARSSPRFQQEEAMGRPFVILSFEPSSFRVEAALGRDHRFSK